MSASEILEIGLDVHADMAADAGDTYQHDLLVALGELAAEYGPADIVRALADVAEGAADAHDNERLKHVATRLADAAAILAGDEDEDDTEESDAAVAAEASS